MVNGLGWKLRWMGDADRNRWSHDRRPLGMVAKTVVAFQAHPDEEVLVTGGTLARLAAGGHRTVVVVACDGVMGDARGAGASVRLGELRASAGVLGVARVVHL